MDNHGMWDILKRRTACRDNKLFVNIFTEEVVKSLLTPKLLFEVCR